MNETEDPSYEPLLSLLPGTRIPSHALLLPSLAVFFSLIALSKGWNIFVAGPMLLAGFPMLFSGRNAALRLLEKGAPAPEVRKFGRLQLLGFVAAYLALPGVGDGEDYLVLGMTIAAPGSRAMIVSWLVLFCGSLAFVFGTRGLSALSRKRDLV